METAKGRNQMTDIQLLKVSEMLMQYGNLIVETELDNSYFALCFESDQYILIDKFGNEDWYLNGELHRTDGPACIGQPDSKGNPGDIAWFMNGKKHRTDGPAVEYGHGHKEWWVNGVDQDYPERGRW
jgi:hypothetical protein